MNAFLLLISLFVVVIGPVNYFLLQRRQRLYLLLVTVPLGALAVTGSLLLYALLTDGLSVRGRVRSLTEIDQRTGQAVAWSRQTYYAGLAPIEGLDYPADAAVYPLAYRPADTPGGRQLTWDGSQRLSGSFLPSRTTVQFLVIESRATSARLRLDVTDEALRAQNQLGAAIVRLLVRAPDGRLLGTAGLADGASAELSEVEPSAEADLWDQQLLAFLPRNPEGFDFRQTENASFFFNMQNYWTTADSSLPDPSTRTSLSERRLTTLFANDFAALPPSGYLAIVDGFVEVSAGQAEVQWEASTQFVFGRW